MAEAPSRPEVARLPMLTEVVAEGAEGAEAFASSAVLRERPRPALPAAAPWPRPLPPLAPAALPVLTESLDALLAPLSEGPVADWDGWAADGAGVDAPPVVDGADLLGAIPPVLAAAAGPEPPAVKPHRPIDDAALVEAVVRALQPRLDDLVDVRLREVLASSLGPAVQAAFQQAVARALDQAVAAWLPEARGLVHATLREVVAQAVAEEAAREPGR